MKFFRKQNVFLCIAKFYGIFYIIGKWVIEKKICTQKNKYFIGEMSVDFQ